MDKVSRSFKYRIDIYILVITDETGNLHFKHVMSIFNKFVSFVESSSGVCMLKIINCSEKIFTQETSYILYTIGYPVRKEFVYLINSVSTKNNSLHYMKKSGNLFSWKFYIA